MSPAGVGLLLVLVLCWCWSSGCSGVHSHSSFKHNRVQCNAVFDGKTVIPDCPEPPNVIAIIGGSLAGVALIGLLVLMLIKLLIHLQDLKEFRKFENEQKKSKWAKVRDCASLWTGQNVVFSETQTGQGSSMCLTEISFAG